MKDIKIKELSCELFDILRKDIDKFIDKYKENNIDHVMTCIFHAYSYMLSYLAFHISNKVSRIKMLDDLFDHALEIIVESEDRPKGRLQ